MRAGFRSVGVSPTPLRGTGILPMHLSHGQSCPCIVGETPTLRGW
ncbi:MAG: hypothetical protein NZ843_07025 [Fimbriimonadales bacterium]|nr:hypothetical protein [Fimbriimonadales bacterium]